MDAGATALDSRIFLFEELSNHTILYIIVGVVIAESAANLLAIPIISRRVRDRREGVEETELGLMEPWLAYA